MEGWRKDTSAISEAFGNLEPDTYGWRNDLRYIAHTLGKEEATGWRDDILYIRRHYELNPPEPPEILFFLNELPRQINTRYVILEDGIIEADKVVIA